jgi:hypothetical protein
MFTNHKYFDQHRPDHELHDEVNEQELALRRGGDRTPGSRNFPSNTSQRESVRHARVRPRSYLITSARPQQWSKV